MKATSEIAFLVEILDKHDPGYGSINLKHFYFTLGIQHRVDHVSQRVCVLSLTEINAIFVKDSIFYQVVNPSCKYFNLDSINHLNL